LPDHLIRKACRFSGGITFLIQPLRTGKPCESKHPAIFTIFPSRFKVEKLADYPLAAVEEQNPRNRRTYDLSRQVQPVTSLLLDRRSRG
jgi:hypothetical protein